MEINNQNEQNLSMALGNLNGGIDAYQLVQGYLTLAKAGNTCKPTFVKSILSGTKLYQHKNKETKVFSEETAYLMTDALKEVAKSGTGKALNALKFDIACKTGTVGDKKGNTDAVICGYTTNETIVIWFSNNNKSEMTGGNQPTIALRSFLQTKYQGGNPQDFAIPDGVVEVDIDSNSLKNEQKVMLSDDNTNNATKFYFKKGSEPTQKATGKIKKLTVNFSANYNVVTITLKKEKDLTYKVIKEYDGEEIICNIDKNCYVDRELEKGKTYYYTVTSYFGNKLIEQSERFAVTLSNSTNNSLEIDTKNDFTDIEKTDEKTLWDNLRKILNLP